MSQIQLSQKQQELVARLQRLAESQLKDLASISESRRQHRQPFGSCQDDSFEQLKSPRKPNALGIFGRRGSGKTTVLTQTLNALINLAKDSEFYWQVLPRPLDLSYAPSEFPHGLTLVHWLHERLKEHTRCTPRCSRIDSSFERASQSYFRGSNGFNDLVRSLALSPEHYASAATKEIGARLSLHQELQDWLDKEAAFNNVNGFVVAIDDIDLPPANRHHSVIWSLLDELHQDRLFLILAGDLQRLQDRLIEEDATRRGSEQFKPDPQAAQDLIYKVLPQVNRVELQPWFLGEREKFPPSGPKSIQDLLGVVGIPTALLPHARALLPPWSRGLENVWRELVFRHGVLDKQRSAESTHSEASADPLRASMTEDWMDILAFLAQSRFEFDLAHQLLARPLTEWVANFRWEKAGASTATLWEQLRDRLQWSDENNLDTGLRDIPELLPSHQEGGLKLQPTQARFAEAMVDFALDKGTLAPEQLINRIPWLREHCANCSVSVLRDQSTLDRELADSPFSAAAALYWIELTTDFSAASVGYWPVLALQLGERQLLAKSSDFPMTGLATLEGASATNTSDFLMLIKGRVGELLPYRNCRLILRVADALAQQPWSILDTVPTRVGFVGLARIAAMLTYRAYLKEGSLGEKTHPAVYRAISRIEDEPEELTDSLLADDFKRVLGESSDMSAVNVGWIPDGIKLLVKAPWFKGLA